MIEALLPLPHSAVTYRQPREPVLKRLAEGAADGLVAYKGVLVTPLITAPVTFAGALTHSGTHHALFGGLSLAASAIFGAVTAVTSLAHITNETMPHQIATERAGHAGKIIATAFGFMVTFFDYGAAALSAPLSGPSWGAAVLSTLGIGGALAMAIHEERSNGHARETHRIEAVADLASAVKTVQPPSFTPPPMDGVSVHPVGSLVVWAMADNGLHGASVDGMPAILDERRWTVTINHPGISVRRVTAKLDDLASSLRVITGGLRIARGEHEHQTVWTVNNTPLAEIAPAGAHPITELDPAARLSIWDGVHLGEDDNNRPVDVRLAGRAGIFIAGAPGSGKSNGVAAVTCTAVAAHDAELWTIDGAGRELAMFDAVARYSTRFDMDEAIDLLSLLKDEMIRRSEILAGLGATEFTREIAHEQGINVIFYVIGEVSHYTANDTEPKAKRKFNSLLTDITPRGRANAMVAVLDSQKPEDRLIPSAIRDQIPLKLALKCETEEQVVTILGRGMQKLCPAHLLPLDEEGKSLGFGYLKGVPGREPFRMRTRLITADERKAVIAARVAGRGTPPEGPGGGAPEPSDDAGWSRPARPSYLRAVQTPQFPDGRRVDDDRVALWNALDRFPGGFTYNEVGELAGSLGILNGRSGVQRPLDNWGRSGYLVKIGTRSGAAGQAPAVWRKATHEEFKAGSGERQAG
jgi:S-DNA-T family DNA segregation ATPase FtsK/SpoIIIE